jgi:hypothetical protein
MAAMKRQGLERKDSDSWQWASHLHEVFRSVYCSPISKLVLIIVLSIAFAGVLAVSCHQSYLTPVREDYEGLVVDKWAGFSESREGSIPYYRLLVEKKGGERIRVRITFDEYQRAKVGSWMKNVSGQIEFGAVPVDVSDSHQ